jgi:DNA-binding beta-propeller fold protein YncE
MLRARIAAVLLPLPLAAGGCSSSEPVAVPPAPKAAEPADSPALTADTRGDAVLAFGADPLAEVATFPLDGTPYGLAYDGTAQVLWVTLTATNEVVGLSTAGAQLREVARFPTVRQPNTVAVDPTSGRVFVGSRATGELQRVDPR